MFIESDYDKIVFYPSPGGMNQKISPELLGDKFSYYIENMLPNSLGENQVRYGTIDLFTSPANIVRSFPFQMANGKKQEILYLSDYQAFSPVSNLRIISSNHIRLTSTNYAKFQPDTYLSIIYRSTNGISPVSYYLIKKITDLGSNTIDMELEINTFPNSLEDFFILQTPTTVTYVANNSVKITVPADFIYDLFYEDGQKIKLVVNATTYDLTIATGGINHSVPGELTFTFDETTVPNFTGSDTVTFSYESSTPEVTNISNSVGIIKIRDIDTNQLLNGPNQSLTNLSVACLPRGEFFGRKYWICNGVDPIMTWDGTTLEIYKEYVKEAFAQTFVRVDNTHFTFVASAGFVIGKYQNNNTIQLKVNGTTSNLTVSNVSQTGSTVTITTSTNLPAFTGTDRIELLYADKPPTFSFMKSINGRLWCLGPGAVSLGYRNPEEALKVYYSYLTFNLQTPFRFFNETTKTVPSDDISARHGEADNLEAIVNVNGYTAFMGRQKTQIFSGVDPINLQAANAFVWVSTLPVGMFHGDLIVELANDATFVSQNGFLSFSTLNVAKQFAASSQDNLDKLARTYINSIDSNIKYRACRSFKYQFGSFGGFKIGYNDAIVSMYDTKFYDWRILSGDFSAATHFLSTLDEALYLYIGNKIYQYGDGIYGAESYGDQGGSSYISFSDTKFITRKGRWANKFCEIDSDYSSSVVVNKNNVISLYVKGDLRESFITQKIYDFPFRGDLLGTILVDEGADHNPDDLGLRFDYPFTKNVSRFKFTSSTFLVSLIGRTKNGPINFKKVRLFGVQERS